VAANARIRDALGWRPRYDDLSAIVGHCTGVGVETPARRTGNGLNDDDKKSGSLVQSYGCKEAAFIAERLMPVFPHEAGKTDADTVWATGRLMWLCQE